MGLDDFMDLGMEDDSKSKDESETEEKEDEDEFIYDGPQDLVELDIDDVGKVLSESGFEFTEISFPCEDFCYAAESDNGAYMMLVQTSLRKHSNEEQEHIRDALLVSVIDSDTQYNVIEPFPIYRIEGWDDELLDTIEEITERKDDLIFCSSCGSVMIIRRTNATNEKIRGCSNYPTCRHKEEV